jgi:hypothetical protein
LTKKEMGCRREHRKKQRAKKHEKRREARRNALPTDKRPNFPKGLSLPCPIVTQIRPLSDFSVVSTGYTGKSNAQPILEKHIWTLNELIEKGLGVFEWDGR